MQSTIAIQNLKCGGCANTIKTKISALDGVDTVAVDVDQSTVTVTVAAEATVAQVKAKLATLGYPEADADNGLLTQAKSFVSCATGRMSKA